MFVYHRIIYFQDTDAAGVVYFANLLAMCHEAYEASLAAAGVELRLFFSNPAVAVPIVHASIDFGRPLFCGDRLEIQLVPTQLSSSEFEIIYTAFANESRAKPVSKAQTRHVCINSGSRTRQDLVPELSQWLDRWRSAT